MSDRPLLKLPDSKQAETPRRGGGGQSLNRPSRERQGERLDPTFNRLARVTANPSSVMLLRQDPEAIAPERAIVFEVSGSLLNFYSEAARIGLEYLADDELDIFPDDDFSVTDKPDATISGRIYLAMPNVEALSELIRLWERYKSGRRMYSGFGIWTQLFGLLKDVRAWGPQDRLKPETLIDWQERLRHEPEVSIRFEVELWFRDNAATRQRAYRAFERAVRELDGAVVHTTAIPEIRYHAALVDLPAVRIRELISDPTVSLARLDEIMFIQPQSMVSFPVDGETESDPAFVQSAVISQSPPIAALLDGLPVQNHQRLQNRLVVDDPDGLEAAYDVSAREHGTAMASLILHGDLNRGERPLDHCLYVRPVLTPVRTLHAWDERTPGDRLLVDHIYQAIRRIKEGEADEPAAAPSVFLINLSLGDPSRPFAGPISPWARLLDYLAYKYGVLFLVSAGNIHEPLSLPEFADWPTFVAAPAEAREEAVLRALNAHKATRTLLSPAEALNVLTVGAAHRDALPPGVSMVNGIDPFANSDLPNASSALGLGYRKVIKPDLLADGGREYLRSSFSNPHLHVEPARQTGRAFGLMAAAPDALGDLSKTELTWGTSAATALTTRAAHLVFDALMDRDGGSMLFDMPERYIPLTVKALLVHGASWGDRAVVIEQFSGRDHYPKKDNVTRFIGHGAIDDSLVLACTSERATLVGYGDIVPGDACLCRIPLPPSLERVVEPRAVTVTLAWFAPINPRHQGYRMVALDAKPGGDKKYSLGVERSKKQPHDKAIDRGTIYHDRRTGERAVSYVDGGDLLLRIAARESAGECVQAIPYAVAVSIEVGVGSSVPVYDEVRSAIVARTRAPVAT